MALSRPNLRSRGCLVKSANRTWSCQGATAAHDPKRTSEFGGQRETSGPPAHYKLGSIAIEHGYGDLPSAVRLAFQDIQKLALLGWVRA